MRSDPLFAVLFIRNVWTLFLFFFLFFSFLFFFDSTEHHVCVNL